MVTSVHGYQTSFISPDGTRALANTDRSSRVERRRSSLEFGHHAVTSPARRVARPASAGLSQPSPQGTHRFQGGENINQLTLDTLYKAADDLVI